MADTIKISLELADAAAQKSLSDFVNKAGKADQNFKKLGDSGKGAFNDIAVHIGKSIGIYEIFAGNLAANVVTGAFDLMKDAAGQLFQTFIADGVKAAQESEDALNSLNVALAQSGQYTDEASERFQAFAKSIQETTAFEDDAVIKNAALIQSMAGLSEEGLERATKAAIELSSALGKDLTSTSEAIAKAANGNTTSLQKMGIQFQKAGTEAGTFENALAAIESRFGGTAASKLNTFTGALEQSKNAFGDLQEETGNLITSNPAIISAIQAVTDIFKTVSGVVGENKNALSLLIADGFIKLIDITKYVVAAFDVLVTGIRMSYNLIMEGTYALIAGVTGILSPFSDTIKEVFDATVQAGGDAKRAVDDLFENGSFSDIQSSLDKVRDAASDSFEKMRNGAETAVPALKNAQNAVRELSEEEQKRVEENNKYVESLARQSESVKAGYDNELSLLRSFYEEKEAADTEADAVNYGLKLAREQNFYADRQILLDENLALEIQRINESTVAEETKNAAKLSAQEKYQVESGKLSAEHAKNQQKLREQERKFEQQQAEYKLSATANLFGALGNLAAIGGARNFEIVKAFNIAEAVTSAYLAITKTLADGGPYPFNIANAAAIGISAFANVARISNTSAPSFEQGGIVPGSSFTGDRVQANVNSGEMILNRQQQTELFNVANGGGGNSGLMERVESLARAVANLAAQPLIVSVDGRELINITRSQLASGRSI